MNAADASSESARHDTRRSCASGVSERPGSDLDSPTRSRRAVGATGKAANRPTRRADAYTVAERYSDRIVSQILTGRRIEPLSVERPKTASPSVLVAAAEALVLSILPKRVDEGRLVAALLVDRRSLRDAFMEIRGRSIYRAMLTLRMLAARHVMEQQPDLPPEVVSRGCGFASYGQFAKEYRVFFGPDALPLAKPRRRRKDLGIS